MAESNGGSGPFEREVAQDGGDNAFGEVIRLAPPSIRMMAFLVSFVAVFTSVFIWRVSYSKKVEVSGAILIIEKPVTVIVPTRGRFEAINVANEDLVKAGQVLAIIKTDLMLQGGLEIAKSLSEDLEGEKTRIRRDIERLEEKVQLAEERYQGGLRTIELESGEARKIIASLEKRQDFLTKKLAKMEKLREKKILASFELESVNQELTSNKERLLNEEQNLASIKARSEGLRIEKESALQTIRETKANLETQITGVSRQVITKKAEQGIEIRANASGRIRGLNTKKGDSANPGTPFLTILPETTELEAEIYVPTKLMAFVKQNDPLYLSIDAFPPQKYGLFLANVKAMEGLAMSDQARDIRGVAEPSYLVRLKLSDQKIVGHRGNFPLASGMAVKTKVTMTTRKLWDWISEPMQRAWKMSAADAPKKGAK